MNWPSLELEVGAGLEQEITDILMQAGALSVDIRAADESQEFVIDGAIGQGWTRIRLRAIYEPDTAMGDVLDALELRTDAKISVHELEDRDWERVCLDRFKPLKITENLWICPGWIAPPEPAAVNIRIDPGMSFGTGTHESTRLCLGWLVDLEPEGRSVLDYGCGSGILAITALKLGASSASATDIEPRSLSDTRENAANNSVEDRLKVLLPDDLEDNFSADIVVANILTQTIIELRPLLLGHLAPAGKLLLAGILQYQANDVKAAFPELAWQSRIDGDWIALLGERG